MSFCYTLYRIYIISLQIVNFFCCVHVHKLLDLYQRKANYTFRRKNFGGFILLPYLCAGKKRISQPMKDYPDRMTPEQARTFRDAVLNIVSQIPRGRVTTYGHIAVLAGWPSHSRMVGRTLRYTPGAESLPCHRVVNKEGRTAPGWSRQRPLLEAEGIHFKPNGHVDMLRHLWEPELY